MAALVGSKLRGVLLALTLISCTTFVSAGSPVLSDLYPMGWQRGTDVDVTFSGARLGDVQEILVYYPGITVKSHTVIDPQNIKVNFSIAADCRLGEHLFRVRTASGVSEARTFWVGALPVVEELEPNTEFATPQAITQNVTVHGTIGGEDVDYFVVEGKKDQRLSVEVEGMRLARGFWDPFVAILNDKRFELATSDDSPLTLQDGRCSVVLPADGKYTIMLREASYGGGSRYRLHIGNFPLPKAVSPAGGKPGEEIEVHFLGDPKGELTQKIKLPASQDDTFRLHCATPDGISPTGFPCRVMDLPAVLDTGKNTNPGAATVCQVPCAMSGTIANPGEVKYYKFPAKKDQTLEIQCFARRLGSALDSVIHISDANGENLGAYRVGTDDNAGPDSVLRFTFPEDKEYVVWIHDHLRKGGPDYFFRLELNTITAKTTLAIPKVDGNNVSNQDRQSIVIPKGGRFATLVNVQRSDWGGPATLSMNALPQGVTLNVDRIDPGFGTVPVVFEATTETAISGQLQQFTVQPNDLNIKAESLTSQDINYNIGLNNVPFHRHFANRVAVAVTETAPYSISVVEPKAGVPQNGSMNLKVVATRAESFKGAITIFPLFTPPGMGIVGSAVIPEGQNEVLVYTNAAPDAGVRKWKTAFIAVADAGQGPVWTSSQLFTLEVQPTVVSFAQERGTVEQGKTTSVFGKVTVNTPFEGEGSANLIGLPTKVTTPAQKLTKDSTELSFPITTDITSPAGKHGIYCQVVLTMSGETLTQNMGGNELRIDVPLPPKSEPAPMANPMPMPEPAAPPKAPEKPLTRLQQLRLEQMEREKAEKRQ
jgi:hypothetical protein